MSSEIAIKVENLSKHYHLYTKPSDRLKQYLFRGRRQFYKEFIALDKITFEIKKGETLGIVGRNGAGKSTLLQMICGTLSPSHGDIDINGRVTAMLELGAGFNPEFTGRENVYMNATMLGFTGKEIDERYDSIIKFADIGEFIDQPVKTYSSGMYVRLAFSVQANFDPDIFIIDEALAVGDAYFVQRCMHRFNELKSNGVTILLVTHDMSAIKSHCDRAIWIDNGSIKMLGNSSEVVDQYISKLFKQKTIRNDNNINKIKLSLQSSSNEYESEIPNIDRRLGNQSCSILGVSVYNADNQRVHAVNASSEVKLSFSITNNNINNKVKLNAGYIFRNYRGEEFASTSMQLEGVSENMCDIGEIVTIEMRVVIPFLHPGPYTFTPTVGYLDNKGIPVLGDKIENAIAIEIISDREIFTPLRLETNIVIRHVGKL